MNHSKIRKQIARRSHKDYAEQIWLRNKMLLDALEEMKKIAEERIFEQKDYSDQSRYYIIVDIGCPHCNDGYLCKYCLWTRVVRIDEKPWACCDVAFGGYTYHQVCEKDSKYGFYIGYGDDNANVGLKLPCVSCFRITKQEFYRSYRKCKAFLEGHIKWTKDPDWGSDHYDEEDFEE